INDKFGLQISDAIWATSEFIKDTWSGVTKAWDSVTTKAGEWIDKVSSAWGFAKTLPGKAGSAISNGADRVAGVFGKGSAGRRKAFADSLAAAGITNPNEVAMLMAQAHHETGGFRSMSESFNYSPEQLRRTSRRARDLSPDQLTGVMKSGPA